jgi:hypothetical protein
MVKSREHSETSTMCPATWIDYCILPAGHDGEHIDWTDRQWTTQRCGLCGTAFEPGTPVVVMKNHRQICRLNADAKLPPHARAALGNPRHR